MQHFEEQCPFLCLGISLFAGFTASLCLLTRSTDTQKRSFKVARGVGATLSNWLRVKALPEGQLQKPAYFVGLRVSGRLWMSRDIAVAEFR